MSRTLAMLLFALVALLFPVMVLLPRSRPTPTEPDTPVPRSFTLTQKRASTFARLALKGIQKEYPNKPGHVLNDPIDLEGPRALHPAFYGCFDWHSSLHGHW